MNKIESFIFAEKLQGTVYSKIGNNYHIHFSSDLSHIVKYNAFIVSNEHVHVTIEKQYSPYAWKIFAGYNFSIKDRYPSSTAFRFEGNEDERFEILVNLHDLLDKIKNMHDKMNDY